MPFATALQEAARDRGIDLGPEHAEAMAAHYRLLRRWNRVVRLTSVTAEAAAIERHFLESLRALPFLHVGEASLLDVGSGNGFPALPLLIAHPALRGLLLEPVARKRAFLREAIRETGLGPRARVAEQRIERAVDLERLGPVGNISARAVGRLPILVRGAARALCPAGRAILFVGEQGLAEARGAAGPGLAVAGVEPIPGRRASYLLILERPTA